ncbi:MAG TPA: tetratricopeptide repeat protein, partial [Rugosimonospora sp.]|nr:tetratricopeptide repeat protein [Rugosimonospora sp.]
AAPVAAARLESGTYRAVVPAQLPPTLRAFTGRRRELARLDALLSRPPGGDPRQQPAVVVSAVSGTAGIGKTSLALHWAHQVASQYPDGQLYVNLCGFHPTAEPVDAAEAVRGFLDALGVPPQRVPSGIDGQIGLYRSLLAGKRVLVLLDNAATADQVRPLLPGAAGCLVVVTSRNQLTGLVATDGAYPLTLDLLTRQEARQLLAARLGADRVAAEAEAVEQIVAGCAGLPLALAIAAARAAHQPRTPLAVLAKELSADGDWLDALDAGEPSTGVRAVFSWSYDRLSAPAARMFRLLGLLPLLGVGVGAAASLAGVPVATARSTLAELVRAQLLSEDGRERYTNHDLLRAYALELAHSHDSAEDRHAALHRVLDHYLHTAFAAAMLLNPTRASPIDLPAIHPEATAQRLSDRGEAQAWFGAEYPALFAAIDYAAGAGFPRHAWQLAWTLQDYCDWQGHWHSMLAIQETAVAAARLAGDPSGEAWAQRGLGIAHMLLSRHDEAFTHLTVGFEHYRRLGDEDGVAHSHHSLGVLLCRQDRYREAVQHARQALEIYRRTGNRDRLPAELNQLGWYYAMLGDYQQTLTHCQQALTAANQIDDQYVAAAAWDSLGYAHHHLGDHTSAIGCYRHGRELRQAVGDRYYEADTLVHLGDAYLAVGQRQAARDAWHQAWEILGELDHPDAGEVIDRIRTLDAALR